MMNKYIKYEMEKSKLQLTCKTSEEYERRMKELIKKLKI